jgi:microsomal dipeptidase-like Zn-dependent dipeptidase
MESTAVTLEDYVDHIEHICRLAGNTRHAAIGGDTDGQGGREAAPVEIDSVADYQKIGDVLRRRGFREDDVANVLHRNWQRFFETCPHQNQVQPEMYLSLKYVWRSNSCVQDTYMNFYFCGF